MPGGDGTGPTGRGPMTGRGMGECVVKLPQGGGSPEGFAGEAGWPVGGRTSASGDVRAIRGMIDSITREIENVKSRIEDLESKHGRE